MILSTFPLSSVPLSTGPSRTIINQSLTIKWDLLRQVQKLNFRFKWCVRNEVESNGSTFVWGILNDLNKAYTFIWDVERESVSARGCRYYTYPCEDRVATCFSACPVSDASRRVTKSFTFKWSVGLVNKSLNLLWDLNKILIDITNPLILRWGDGTINDGWIFEKQSNISVTSSPSGLDFSPDGTKVYLCAGNAANRLSQYPLSTPWDINTLGTVAINTVVSATNCWGVRVRADDGSSLWYNRQDGAVKRICGIDLPAPYTIVGAVSGACKEPTPLPSPGENHDGLFIHPNGEWAWTSNGSYIVEWKMTIAWDVSTWTHVQDKLLSVGGAGQDLYFTSNGLRLYTVLTKHIQWRDLTIPWDISTVSVNADYSLPTDGEGSSAEGIYVRQDKLKLYTVDIINRRIHQYKRIGT